MNRQGKKTILLVEDDLVISMLESQAIKSFGFNLITADTGEKAVEIALSNDEISLILMDIELGRGIDGPEAAFQILKKRNIPIVFLTSHSEREMVEKVRGITRYGYILKDSGNFVLQSSIEMAFELFEAHEKTKVKENELMERAKHSMSLLRLSGNLERAQSYKEVLNAALDEVRNIVGYQTLATYIMTEDKNHFKTLVAGGSMSDIAISEEEAATITIKGDGMMQEILEAKEIVIVEDAQTDERVNKEIMTRFGFRTIVNVPIVLFDQNPGTVSMYTAGDEGVLVPSNSEQKYLIALARYMAVAFDRIRSLTRRKFDKKQILKLNRIYAVLSNINQTIVRIQGTKELLNESCRIAVEDGKLQMAWIGMVNLLTNEVDVVASYGVAGNYLENINIDLQSESRSNGCTGIAVKTGTHKISNDIQNDDSMIPWRDDAINYGYKSSAAFPLIVFGKVVGAFNIYSDETDFFEEDDIKLLDEMAKDISFALEFIETETKRKRAENELQESEKRLSQIIDFLPDATYAIDMSGKVIAWNHAIEEMTGVNAEEMLGKGNYEYSLPFYGMRRPILIDLVFIPDEEITKKYWFVRKEGECLFAEADVPVKGKTRNLWGIARPLYDSMGNMVGAIESIRDISEHKQAENELKLRNTILSTQQEASIDGILVINENRKIISFNSRFSEIWGIPTDVLDTESDEEVLNYVANKIVESDVFFRKIHYLCENKYEKNQDEIILTDGKILGNYSAPMVGSDGKYYGRVLYFRDITDIKLTEKALAESGKKYRTIVENINDAMIIHDFSGNIIDVNENTCKLFNYSKDEFIGSTLAKIDSEDNNETFSQRMKQLFEKHSLLFEGQHITKDGAVLFTEVSSKVFSKVGRGLVQSFIREVTERKKAENELRESETRFRQLIEEAPIAMFLSKHGIINYVNKTYLQTFGYDNLGELYDKSVLIQFAPQLHEEIMKRVRLRAAGEHVPPEYESIGIHKDGTQFPMYVVVKNIMISDERVNIGFLFDITNAKHAEESIKISEERYRTIVENINDALIIHDFNGNITSINENTCKMFGYTKDEFDGVDIYKVISDQNIDYIKEKKLELMEHNSLIFEVQSVKKDGSMLPLEISSKIISREGSGSVQSFIRDISERKHAENAIRQKQEADIANKAKSEFLANMSHEIRTPLTAIIGSTELLSRTPLNETQQTYTQMLDTAGETLLNLIDSILDISRIEADSLNLSNIEFNFPETIEKICRLIAFRAERHKLDFECNIEEGIPSDLTGDSKRLMQILINLLGNSIKFTKKGKITLDIKANSYISKIDVPSLFNSQNNTVIPRIGTTKESDFDIASPELAMTENGKTNDTIEICFAVSDTGIGIPQDKLDIVFEKFTQIDSSQSRKHKGAGLGLAISKKLVELMGGQIWVQSKLEEGTTFYFIVPFRIQTRREQKETPKIKISKERLNILLAEDEKYSRLILVEHFKDTPYKVDTAENGEIAVNKFIANKYDLVFMDIQMPVMDGFNATKTIREHENKTGMKHTPIIALTASAFKESVEKSIECGFDEYITKPVKRKRLLQAVYDHTGHMCETEFETRKEEAKKKEFFKELIPELIADIKVNIDTMNEKIAQNDCETIAALAHKIKGTSLFYGLTDVSSIAASVVILAREQNIEDLKIHISQLADCVNSKIRE